MTSTSQGTLADFLLARIAEDEAELQQVIESWGGVGEPGTPLASAAECSAMLAARVLAECEAKRRLLEIHGPDAPICAWTQDSMGTHRDEPCDTLLALAQPYADHPEFREEWRWR